MAHEVAYRPKTSDIPTRPGVYRFLDGSGRVLYVGKAKNLRARLSSYFAPLNSLHERTRRMVTTAVDVTWTVVKTELEALQLEFTWIKEFDPPFNIQFTDDKSYPYLAITLEDSVPRVLVTRRRNIPKATYFGPFTKTWAIRESLDLLLKPFPVRTCTDSVFTKAQRAKRPCLLGDIGRCAAPCADRISVEEHHALAEDLAEFVAGSNEGFIDRMRTRMTEASEAQDYETAARYRDSVEALTTVAAKSAVVLSDELDADVFGVARDDLTAAVAQFIVRSGRVRGARGWTVNTELNVETADLIDNLLLAAYSKEEIPPAIVMLPDMPTEETALTTWLTNLRRERLQKPRLASVKMTVPVRGEARRLLDTVSMNAMEQLVLFKNRRANDYSTRSQAMADIQASLGLSEPPLRIECFDVSHLQGSGIVASMVVFEDGLPKKGEYRKFGIDNARDDTDALAQVLQRRLTRLVESASRASSETTTGPTSFHYAPGLLLVDGGAPQVSTAKRVVDELGLNIPVAGIAKRLEEVWLPGQEFPVILPRTSEALYLIQRARDEAHRFAISFQRTKRRRDIGTVLTSISGMGDKRAKALLKHFGSVAALRQATVAEIGNVSGITPHLAERIVSSLRDGTSPSE